MGKEITSEQKKIIEQNPIAIATSDGGGKPNISAAAFVKVVEGMLVITDNYMSGTVRNIKIHSAVSIIAWDRSLKGVKVNGKAEYFPSGKWLDFVKSLKENRDEKPKGAIVVTPDEVYDAG